MAARMRAFLAGKGLEVTRLSNADHFAHAMTTVTYLPGHRALAEVLSASLPIAPQLEQVSGQPAAMAAAKTVFRIGSDSPGCAF